MAGIERSDGQLRKGTRAVHRTKELVAYTRDLSGANSCCVGPVKGVPRVLGGTKPMAPGKQPRM